MPSIVAALGFRALLSQFKNPLYRTVSTSLLDDLQLDCIADSGRVIGEFEGVRAKQMFPFQRDQIWERPPPAYGCTSRPHCQMTRQEVTWQRAIPLCSGHRNHA
jgi:hypothetical protein